MKLWFRINGLEFCSWFIVWKQLMKAFKEIGVEVCNSPFNSPEGVSEYVELHWGDPQFWNWSGKDVKLRAGYALSEHRSLLHPEKAIPNLQKCQVLMSPCQSAAQAYYEAPLDMPIGIAPFGIDESEMTYYNRDWQGELKFLVIGAAQFRKGTWLAVEAFRQAFGDRSDISLAVASFMETSMFNRLKADYQKYPNIKFYGKATDVREYYQKHHILVSPHLSEGWSLTIPEAMATGMACIVARCSAPREYFTPTYGWWSEMSEDYAPVDQCLPGVKGSWRLPSMESLAEKMKYVADHREECKEKGRWASEYARTQLTWKQSAKKIVDILEEYCEFTNARSGLME